METRFGSPTEQDGVLWDGWAAAWLDRRLSTVSVEPAPTRTTVRVDFPDGRAYRGPAGTPVEQFVWRAVRDRAREDSGRPALYPIAVLVDRRLRELSMPVDRDASVEIVDLAHPDGRRIYRRSLTLLLLAAAHRLYPGAEIAVEHSLPFGAYFCSVEGRPPFTQQELQALETEMRRMVEADLPITKRRLPLEQVTRLFEELGDESKVKLMAHRAQDLLLQRDEISLYRLDRVENTFHGYMVPSTGYLRWFDLVRYGPGFLLRFPRSPWGRAENPFQLPPVTPSDKLVRIFHEYREWMTTIGLRDLGSLNEAVQNGRITEMILVSEALHERRIAHIGSLVAESWRASDRERIRVVFVAGPSSSGKTTFAKRLGIQLLSYGIRPYALSLDNYFVDRDKTPRDEEGNYDFEALEAIDLARFNEQLAALLAGQEVTLPRYNFVTGRSEVGDTVRLASNQVLIIEGIHGLNPALTERIPAPSALRVYVSVLAHLNLDRHNRVSTSDVRLLRRIARDHRHRGYTAADTLRNWPNVRRGEERYIFPFQENADVIFNAALLYELSVLRPVVEPLLLQIEWDTPAYVEARRLLALLRWVRPADAALVPDNSIIREFIGGSILRRFRLA